MTQYDWLTCVDAKKMNDYVLATMPLTQLEQTFVKLTTRQARLIALHALAKAQKADFLGPLMPYRGLEDLFDNHESRALSQTDLTLLHPKVISFFNRLSTPLLRHCEAFLNDQRSSTYYCQLVRSILGDPFVKVMVGRVAIVERGRVTYTIPPDCLDGEACQLARQIYEDRWFAGMPVLIDAMTDKGLDESVECPACKGKGEWEEPWHKNPNMERDKRLKPHDDVDKVIVQCGRCNGSKRITHPVVSHVRTPHCPTCYKSSFDDIDGDLQKLHHDCPPYPHVRGDWLLDLILNHARIAGKPFNVGRIDG